MTARARPRGNGTTTTTWYAFQDPKTGREYFHEPVSGKTSWVRPTEIELDDSTVKSSNASRLERAGSGLPHSEVKKMEGKEMDEEHTKGPRNKQLRGWGIAVASILIFNTLFLLVLVKVLYENNNGPRQITDHIKQPVQARETSVELNLSRVMENDTLNGDVNKLRTEKENHITAEEPSISTSTSTSGLSRGSYSPEDAGKELNYEYVLDSEIEDPKKIENEGRRFHAPNEVVSGCVEYGTTNEPAEIENEEQGCNDPNEVISEKVGYGITDGPKETDSMSEEEECGTNNESKEVESEEHYYDPSKVRSEKSEHGSTKKSQNIELLMNQKKVGGQKLSSILVEKCQQVRTRVGIFFRRLVHVWQRLVSGR